MYKYGLSVTAQFQESFFENSLFVNPTKSIETKLGEIT